MLRGKRAAFEAESAVVVKDDRAGAAESRRRAGFARS
jgi:hypothetical protein